MVCPYPDIRGSTHPCGNNIDVKPIMEIIKRDTNAATWEGRSMGVGEGTCVCQCVGVLRLHHPWSMLAGEDGA
jgi:hypothetical protein